MRASIATLATMSLYLPVSREHGDWTSLPELRSRRRLPNPDESDQLRARLTAFIHQSLYLLSATRFAGVVRMPLLMSRCTQPSTIVARALSVVA